MKKYIKNTIWFSADRVIRAILQLLGIILIIRYLGPTVYGELSYAISIIAILAPVVMLGMEGVILRELSVDESDTDKIILNTLLMGGGASVLSIICCIFIGYTGQEGKYFWLVLLLSLGYLTQPFLVFDLFFQSESESFYVACASAIQGTISLLLKIILIIMEADIYAFAAIIVFEQFFLVSLLIYVYVRRYGLKFVSEHPNRIFMRSMFKESWPLLLSGILVAVYMKIDQVIIFNMIGASELGKYSAALRISESWYFVALAISSSFMPALMRHKSTSPAAYLRYLEVMYMSVIWIGIVACIVVFIANDWIIEIIYGPEYSDSALILQIHIWAAAIASVGIAKGRFMLVEGIQFLSLYYTAVAVILNVSLNIVFVPEYGIRGAAYAALLTQVASVLLLPMAHPVDRRSTWLFIRCLLLRYSKNI